jgi:hypothetical protein
MSAPIHLAKRDLPQEFLQRIPFPLDDPESLLAGIEIEGVEAPFVLG